MPPFPCFVRFARPLKCPAPRDKGWVEHDLAGSYVSVMNGHGAGQLRRIADNGLDWIKVEVPLTVGPGPISSYMVIAREDALLEDVPGTSPPVKLPKTDPVTGALVDDPGIDYSRRPLCIHRAPVNINTASPVVLAALFLGLNVQHGHPMSIGTDVDRRLIWPDTPPAPPGDPTTWVTCDPKLQEPYLLTVRGLKRLPASSGKIAFDRPMPTGASDFEYLNRYGALDPAGSGNVTEAHELAYRILLSRQDKEPDGKPLGNDPLTGLPRGPFRNWDDLYFRVIKPWQKERLDPAKNPDADRKWEVAPMLMAHFNPNTDLLKFNPNIEWIDRWGRNFTEMEPVMVFETDASGQPTVPLWVPGDAQNMWSYCEVTYGGRPKGAYCTRSLRYRSEELIDKTDLNRSTTELSFDSNGIYHVRSTGQMMMGGQLLAERKLETLVKVYDVWRESTQRQFVQGVISKAQGRPGGNASGQIARDARNVDDRLALTTLPEPLVPPGYRIPDPGRLSDVVGGTNDAFGKPKPRDLPDVLANRVLPALYDGQLVLATNTMDRSDHTTFLASFDGDLDTTTCDGNGREQAKIPVNRRIRALDTISLLGLLNDRQVDFDLMDRDNDANGNVHKTQAQFNTFPVSNLNKTLRALRPEQYWDHLTCRMGDLRADGVFLGNVGCSGKDATLKYLVDGNWPIARSSEGTVCLWFKPNWQCTDNREHEFFNACNRGTGFGARYNILVKFGRFSWCIPQGGGGDDGVACSGGQHVGFNDLCFNLEDQNDADCKTYLHGGKMGVPGSIRESPAYHVQPFRWGFVGGRVDAKQKGDNSPEYSGFWKSLSADGRNSRDAVITSVMRPFIDSARDPEGKGTWNSRYFWKQMNTEQFAAIDIGTRNRQCAAWDWADGGTADSNAVFGANNLNMAGVPKSQWLYRASPIDGTLAVVDEYRLSSKCWDSDTIRKWMTTSRYYLPDHPDNPSECPMFVSQSLIQSLRGFDKTAPKEPEYVRVARVSWNVFTPRFLYENMEPKGTRKEIVKTSLTDDSKVSAPAAASHRGPFDFVQYNHDILPGLVNNNSTLPYEPDVNPLVSRLANGATVHPLHCHRPPPPAYGGWSQAARGVEIELLDTAAADDFGSPPLLGLTFRNPDLHNSVTDAAGRPALVAADRLRYRVRFRYPVDPLVDPGKGEWVNPAEHYLVDTPVFDDISVTYFPKSRIVDYREVNE